MYLCCELHLHCISQLMNIYMAYLLGHMMLNGSGGAGGISPDKATKLNSHKIKRESRDAN